MAKKKVNVQIPLETINEVEEMEKINSPPEEIVTMPSSKKYSSVDDSSLFDLEQYAPEKSKHILDTNKDKFYNKNIVSPDIEVLDTSSTKLGDEEDLAELAYYYGDDVALPDHFDKYNKVSDTEEIVKDDQKQPRYFRERHPIIAKLSDVVGKAGVERPEVGEEYDPNAPKPISGDTNGRPKKSLSHKFESGVEYLKKTFSEDAQTRDRYARMGGWEGVPIDHIESEFDEVSAKINSSNKDEIVEKIRKLEETQLNYDTTITDDRNKIDELNDNIDKYNREISKLDKLLTITTNSRDVKALIDQREEFENKKVNDQNTISKLTKKINRLEADKKAIDSEKTKYAKAEQDFDKNVNALKTKQRDLILQQTKYSNAVQKGREKFDQKRSLSARLSKYGEGAHEAVGDVFQPGGRGVLRQEWFGAKGFMAQPYKRAYVTSSVVEPVRTKLSNLDAITRQTGSSMGKGAIQSAIEIHPSERINTLGVPGSISKSDIRDRFDYGLTLKKIMPSDVTATVNRGLVPSIMEKKVVPLQMAPSPQQVRYRQVMQADGTILNVPLQQRGSKYSSGIGRIVKNVKDVPVTRTPKSIDAFSVHGLLSGINSIGTMKSNKNILHGGSISLNQFCTNTNNRPVKVDSESRNSKKSSPLINLKFTDNISKNLNKFTKGKKKNKKI